MAPNLDLVWECFAATQHTLLILVLGWAYQPHDLRAITTIRLALAELIAKMFLEFATSALLLNIWLGYKIDTWAYAAYYVFQDCNMLITPPFLLDFAYRFGTLAFLLRRGGPLLA